jgi:hypothetical protein
VGFVIECISGEFYPNRDVTIMGPYKLDIERANGFAGNKQDPPLDIKALLESACHSR